MELKTNNNIPNINILRGLAALSVTLFHLSYTMNNTFWLKSILSYGYLGVSVFFVISGFIIPYSMYKANFTINQSLVFLKKRIIRIEPPYLISIVFILLLNYLATLVPYYHGVPFHINWKALVLHLGYLNAFFGYDWICEVYWTLGIEFQYYILIIGFFYFIIHKNKILFLSLIFLFCLCSFFIKDRNIILTHSINFSIGILLFRYLVIDNRYWPYLIIIAGLITILAFHNLVESLLILGSILFLLYSKDIFNKYLLLLGEISFSLYLLHIPIGTKIMNFSNNFIMNDYWRSLILLVALLSSIITAYIYYRLVEKPFVNMSKKIKYKQ